MPSGKTNVSENHLASIFGLGGKVAVVTGGNRGIGLGLATGLAKAGASLALWGRDEARNQLAAEELRSFGVEAQEFSCDVSQEDDVVSATAATLERFGQIDIGIANAGFGRLIDPLKGSLDDWHHVTATNLDGVFLTFREISKHMVERGGGGKLIAVSSMVEDFGSPRQAHYAASKAGTGAIVRSYAVELARHNIQVNGLKPGWIATEALQPITQSETTTGVILKRTPARRYGEAADLEGIAVYLASDASRYHTGDSIMIDGGYSVF